MLIVYSGQANELNLKVVDKQGSAITTGTVNFYLKQTTGDNAGKWYRGSDGTWQAGESIAGAGSHVSDGDWKLSLASAVWESHAAYRVYVIESGDLHIPNGDDILCAPYGGSIVAGSGPLTRAVVKQHLKVEFDTDDDLIDIYQLTATTHWEAYTGRVFVSRSVTEKFDKFPAIFRPKWAPLASVDSITYVDSNGDPQTLDSALYDVDTTTEPGRAAPAYGESWPMTRPQINAVTLTYTAGYGQAADVPDPIKQAILLTVAHLYNYRDAVSNTKLSGHTFPAAAKHLVIPFKVFY
jgi:uncharacterized phiE125 gp8 family phage protein